MSVPRQNDSIPGTITELLRGLNFGVRLEDGQVLRCGIHQTYVSDRVKGMPRRSKLEVGDAVRIVLSSPPGAGLIVEKVQPPR